MTIKDTHFKYLTLTYTPISQESYKTKNGYISLTPTNKLEAMFFELMSDVTIYLTEKYPLDENGHKSNFNKNVVFNDYDYNYIQGKIKEVLEFYCDEYLEEGKKQEYGHLYTKVFQTPILVDGRKCYFNFNIKTLTKMIGSDVQSIIYRGKEFSYPLITIYVNELAKVVANAYNQFISKEVLKAYKLLSKNPILVCNRYDNSIKFN